MCVCVCEYVCEPECVSMHMYIQNMYILHALRESALVHN